MILKELIFLLVQLSVIWNFSQAQLQITKFSMAISFQPAQTITRDLMNPGDIVSIAPHANNMSLTCVASGNSEPEITILHNYVTLVSSRGEVHHVVHNITCQDSGVYTCQAKNRLNLTQIQKKIQVKRPDKIESFIIRAKEPIGSGSNAKMICRAAKCSEPLTMAIVDDTGTVKKKVIQTESLAHEIRNLQCSDMGTYFCRVETETGKILEEQLDLEIWNCAPQVCRGEDKTKTVYAVVGQSLNVSVCIISYYTPSWPQTYSRVHVSFIPRTPSSLYYTSTVTISDIREEDQGNKTIRLFNAYSSMDYTINLLADTTTSTTAILSSSPPSPATTTASPAGTSPSPLHNNSDLSSQESTNYIYIIIIIVVLIVIVIALVIGVLVYRYRGCVKEDNSKDSHINLEEVISPYAHYEEIGNVDAVLSKGSGEQTNKTSSDAHGGEVQYEVAVTQTSSVDTEHNYEELKDDPPGAPRSYQGATVKPLTMSPDSVEYENTLCII